MERVGAGLPALAALSWLVEPLLNRWLPIRAPSLRLWAECALCAQGTVSRLVGGCERTLPEGLAAGSEGGPDIVVWADDPDLFLRHNDRVHHA